MKLDLMRDMTAEYFWEKYANQYCIPHSIDRFIKTFEFNLSYTEFIKKVLIELAKDFKIDDPSVTIPRPKFEDFSENKRLDCLITIEKAYVKHFIAIEHENDYRYSPNDKTLNKGIYSELSKLVYLKKDLSVLIWHQQYKDFGSSTKFEIIEKIIVNYIESRIKQDRIFLSGDWLCIIGPAYHYGKNENMNNYNYKLFLDEIKSLKIDFQAFKIDKTTLEVSQLESKNILQKMLFS